MQNPSPSRREAPLKGVRVVDLTRVLAGPYATMLLADLGADVIKVERTDQGEETRIIPPLKNGESHYFLSINKNKRSIAVDLKAPEGRAIILDLVRQSDVVIENFRPGVLKRLNLEYETLAEVNPRIILCSISAYGQTGPWAERSAFDLVIQAMSGVMSVTGEPGRPPVRLGLPVGDLSGGIYAVIGILGALYERERSGRGQAIDVSMLDALVGQLGYLVGYYAMTGQNPGRVGSGHHNIVPYGAFKAKDGYIIIAVLTESFWPKLCKALGLEHMVSDPRYANMEKRKENRDEVNRAIEEVLQHGTVAEWSEIFLREDVPHAPVLEISDVVQHPQLRARNMMVEVE
ncbi:MAG TPA: CoA transferase, partial [Bacillota bacterium]